MKRGPKSLLGTTMTHAERQARYRASQAGAHQKCATADLPITEADHSGGVTPSLNNRAAERVLSMARRLPESLATSAPADTLQMICELLPTSISGWSA